MVPEDFVQRWEAAYRRYGEAAKVAAVWFVGNENAAREMVAASREVAAAWRAMESTQDLPWWTVAAVSAAVQAFEFQAQDWSVDTVNLHAATLLGPARQLVSQPRPTPYRRTREAGEQP